MPVPGLLEVWPCSFSKKKKIKSKVVHVCVESVEKYNVKINADHLHDNICTRGVHVNIQTLGMQPTSIFLSF